MKSKSSPQELTSGSDYPQKKEQRVSIPIIFSMWSVMQQGSEKINPN